MFNGLKRVWRGLKQSEPGSRFRDYHRAHQGSKRAKWSKLLWMGLGILLIVMGAVLIPTPLVPGWVPVIIGAALVARESAATARVLDWLELRSRAAVGQVAAVWKRASLPEKIVAGLSGLAIAGVTVAWVYSLTFGV